MHGGAFNYEESLKEGEVLGTKERGFYVPVRWLFVAYQFFLAASLVQLHRCYTFVVVICCLSVLSGSTIGSTSPVWWLFAAYKFFRAVPLVQLHQCYTFIKLCNHN